MPTALITGASSGIGEAFARQLARQQTNLVLVARSQDKLEALATELTEQYGIETEVIVRDLTEGASGKFLFDRVKDKGIAIDLLINNAGFGDYGAFGDRPLTTQLTMIQLNIAVLVELTGLFLPVMKQRGSGTIINISSIAGFQPLPYMSVYAATKAFVLNFTEALWAETKDTGVNILAVCPGPTESEFFQRADFPEAFAANNGKGSSLPSNRRACEPRNNLTSAETVVSESLKALAKKQSTIVTGGIGNQIIVNLPRILPRDLLVSAVEKQFKR